jgi:hypothetical protein
VLRGFRKDQGPICAADLSADFLWDERVVHTQEAVRVRQAAARVIDTSLVLQYENVLPGEDVLEASQLCGIQPPLEGIVDKHRRHPLAKSLIVGYA